MRMFLIFGRIFIGVGKEVAEAAGCVSVLNVVVSWKIYLNICALYINGHMTERKRLFWHMKTDVKVKDYHKKRCCPKDNCFYILKRLGPHLQNVHGIKPTTSEYKACLENAKLFQPTILKKERKRKNKEFVEREELHLQCERFTLYTQMGETVVF